MRHITAKRLGITAGCIAGLALFANLLTAVYGERIPWWIQILTFGLSALLGAMAVAVWRIEHTLRLEADRVVRDLTVIVTSQLADSERRMAHVRDDVADLISPNRIERILRSIITPLAVAEVQSALADQRRRDRHHHNGDGGNVRSMPRRGARDADA